MIIKCLARKKDFIILNEILDSVPLEEELWPAVTI